MPVPSQPHRRKLRARQSPASKPSSAVSIECSIHLIRGERVILDADLARICSVKTKVLNRAVMRNREKFPSDFLLERTSPELIALNRSQSLPGSSSQSGLRSQIVTASKRNVRFLPHAFTENGAVMAANVLNSPEAVRMSVHVVRAFIQMRVLLAGSTELAAELKKLEAKLTSRLDSHESAIVDVLQRIMLLLDPPPGPDVPAKEMGYHTTLKKPAKHGTK